MPHHRHYFHLHCPSNLPFLVVLLALTKSEKSREAGWEREVSLTVFMSISTTLCFFRLHNFSFPIFLLFFLLLYLRSILCANKQIFIWKNIHFFSLFFFFFSGAFSIWYMVCRFLALSSIHFISFFVGLAGDSKKKIVLCKCHCWNCRENDKKVDKKIIIIFCGDILF